MPWGNELSSLRCSMKIFVFYILSKFILLFYTLQMNFRIDICKKKFPVWEEKVQQKSNLLEPSDILYWEKKKNHYRRVQNGTWLSSNIYREFFIQNFKWSLRKMRRWSKSLKWPHQLFLWITSSRTFTPSKINYHLLNHDLKKVCLFTEITNLKFPQLKKIQSDKKNMVVSRRKTSYLLTSHSNRRTATSEKKKKILGEQRIFLRCVIQMKAKQAEIEWGVENRIQEKEEDPSNPLKIFYCSLTKGLLEYLRTPKACIQGQAVNRPPVIKKILSTSPYPEWWKEKKIQWAVDGKKRTNISAFLFIDSFFRWFFVFFFFFLYEITKLFTPNRQLLVSLILVNEVVLYVSVI